MQKKDLSRKDVIIRRELFKDIEDDVNQVLNNGLKIKITKLYIISTYNDHPDLDEFCDELKENLKTEFENIYWGWQTIENRVSNHKGLLEKYWSNFIIKLPTSEQEFKRNFDLRKKNKNRFC
ncbi:hypothetical protein H9X57_16210 [Flavobacterium piscinae]|uniref:hypothetical protein n=1 Tax=Flavobacterium piscinae TaxID=2506424 RepID=UPI0019C09616|nr:hypothetical protein [Flavobacterium piscinae]MBC8884357.1 hypothetical protein [Flavobacterium piscinae]